MGRRRGGKNQPLLISCPRWQALPLRPIRLDQWTFHRLNGYLQEKTRPLRNQTYKEVCNIKNVSHRFQVGKNVSFLSYATPEKYPSLIQLFFKPLIHLIVSLQLKKKFRQLRQCHFSCIVFCMCISHTYKPRATNVQFGNFLFSDIYFRTFCEYLNSNKYEISVFVGSLLHGPSMIYIVKLFGTWSTNIYWMNRCNN